MVTVVNHAVSATLEAAACYGSMHTNAGAGAGAVILTAPLGKAGMTLLIYRKDAGEITFKASTGATVSSSFSMGGVCRKYIYTGTEWIRDSLEKTISVYNHGSGATSISSSTCAGDIHTNSGAGGAASVWTLPAGVSGMQLYLKRTDAGTIEVKDSGGTTLFVEVPRSLQGMQLTYSNGAWSHTNKIHGLLFDHSASETTNSKSQWQGIHTAVGGSAGTKTITSSGDKEGMQMTLINAANDMILKNAGGTIYLNGGLKLGGPSAAFLMYGGEWKVLRDKESSALLQQVNYYGNGMGPSYIDMAKATKEFIHTNDVVGDGPVYLILTSPVEGMIVRVVKTYTMALTIYDDMTPIIGNSTAANISSTPTPFIELLYTSGRWIVTSKGGTWA